MPPVSLQPSQGGSDPAPDTASGGGGSGRRTAGWAGFLSYLAGAQATRHLPVIVLTGAEAERAAEALSLGADEFLAKPFSLSVLGAAVERLLRQAPDGGRR